MVMIKLRGYEFDAIAARDSFNRRALKYKNNIISTLKLIGLTEDDIEIDVEPNAMKKLPATAVWYFEGFRLHYSYKAGNKYVDNLYVISKLLELEVKAIKSGEKELDQFILDYSESDEIEKEQKAARELLGVDSESLDLNEINKRFKLLARDLHPDMPGGDAEKFKALNRAYKILKRELG